MTRKQTIEIKVGQWWANSEEPDFRRMKITHLTKYTVTYLDVYPETKDSWKRVCPRIQWEFDVERGNLVPSTSPGTKPA